jgi:hypothetical protein
MTSCNAALTAGAAVLGHSGSVEHPPKVNVLPVHWEKAQPKLHANAPSSGESQPARAVHRIAPAQPVHSQQAP